MKQREITNTLVNWSSRLYKDAFSYLFLLSISLEDYRLTLQWSPSRLLIAPFTFLLKPPPLNPLAFSLTNWTILRLSWTLLIDLPPLLLAPLFPLLTTRLIRSRDQEHVGYISICHIRMSTLNITIRQQTSLNGGASIARKSTQLMEGLVVSSSVASSVKRTEKYALFDD